MDIEASQRDADRQLAAAAQSDVVGTNEALAARAQMKRNMPLIARSMPSG